MRKIDSRQPHYSNECWAIAGNSYFRYQVVVALSVVGSDVLGLVGLHDGEVGLHHGPERIFQVVIYGSISLVKSLE